MVYPQYDCVCDPSEVSGLPWVRWIGYYLHDCVYTTEEIASVCLGLLNLAFWIPALLPQIITNYRTGRVDALSGLFVLQWLAGDVSNLLGCLLTNQLETQLITSVYFVCGDVILMGQYIYYKGGRKAWKRLSHRWQNRNTEQTITNGSAFYQQNQNTNGGRTTKLKSLIGLSLAASLVLAGSAILSQPNKPIDQYNSLAITTSSAHSRMARVLHSIPPAASMVYSPHFLSSPPVSAPLCNSPPEISEAQLILGSILAWCSGLLYFSSRFPQVVKNFRRRSVEGLSLGLFFCAVAANLCYGVSIIFRLPVIDRMFWLNIFPYLIGSLGTIIFDLMILSQAWAYGAFSRVDPKDKQLYKEIRDNPEANDTDSEHDEEYVKA